MSCSSGVPIARPAGLPGVGFVMTGLPRWNGFIASGPGEPPGPQPMTMVIQGQRKIRLSSFVSQTLQPTTVLVMVS
jgi:hypothetical protein